MSNLNLKEVWLIKEMWPVDDPWGVPDTDDPDSDNYYEYDYEHTEHFVLPCPYCRSNEPLALVGDLMVCKTCRSQWVASSEDRSNIGRAELEKYGRTDNSPFEIYPHHGQLIQASDEDEAYDVFRDVVLKELGEFVSGYYNRKKPSSADSVVSSYFKGDLVDPPTVFENDNDVSKTFVDRFMKDWEDRLRSEFEEENGWMFVRSKLKEARLMESNKEIVAPNTEDIRNRKEASR